MKVSIITASYNYESYIKDAIESVIAQTYQEWEMIIVDDGSRDNSVEIIKNYCNNDSRIRLYQHDNGKNKGLAQTLRLGVEKSETNWIVFLEADDTITPDYLEKKILVLQKYPDLKFIFNDVNLFGDIERIKKYDEYFSLVYKILKSRTYPDNLLNCFEENNIIPTFSCVMLKKELWNSLDFNSPLRPCLDYYLWLQIARRTEMYYLSEKLTNWRMHKNSYITKSNEFNDFNNLLFKIKRKIFINGNGINTVLFAVYQYIKLLRRQVIRIHFKEKELCLFGKWWFKCKKKGI